MATLPFYQMVRASGSAEPWVHTHEDSKFDQFGWRCTNKESGYGNQTLVGNYNEEIFDIRERIKAKPLPSQHNHYFETSYTTDFNEVTSNLPEDAKNLRRRHPHSFPGHQPEFDTNEAKTVYNDFQTTSMVAYKPFGMKKIPPIQNKQANEAESTPLRYNVQMETTPITHLGARAGPPATGNHVIAPPHAGPGSGLGTEQKSHRTYVGE